jgi:chorismate mutase
VIEWLNWVSKMTKLLAVRKEFARWQLRLCVLGLAIALLPVVGCRSASLPEGQPADLANLNHVLQLMHQRLELMHDVARWKWNAGKPIADPQREAELLESVVQKGREKVLDPELARSFFSAQIEAARLVQQADFERWKTAKQGPFAETTSLEVLRKRIDELNMELIDPLGKLGPPLGEPGVQEALSQRALMVLTGEGQSGVREIAIGPLLR